MVGADSAPGLSGEVRVALGAGVALQPHAAEPAVEVEGIQQR